MSPKAAFQASRLTPTTFLIKEYDDIFSEHPHIYAKIVPSANSILIIDTGCGGKTNDREIVVKSLRAFIETIPVSENGNVPLNQGGKLEYIVALSHCHYDHILGVEDFADSLILASSHQPRFVDKAELPTHSLCKALGLKTPSYTPTLVPDQYEILSPKSPWTPLGVTIMHTPGHTPDEIALYDDTEMMLYVGDSLYEDEPIIFPHEGSIVNWFTSMDFLMTFVRARNAAAARASSISSASIDDGNRPKEVLINAGHCTAMKPALEVLSSACAFMRDVVSGKERVKERGWNRGKRTVSYVQEGGRFSLRCPEDLVLEAKNAVSY